MMVEALWVFYRVAQLPEKIGRVENLHASCAPGPMRIPNSYKIKD